ncbi:hypothetical protein ACIBH1_06780 [Nonomuraea sp. NPDC050663]|uniref:hypothetical protein n=1 Tax=Nonomuraea sp. NPDC050663 TaxID=3364370 RepID=UPI00379580BB
MTVQSGEDQVLPEVLPIGLAAGFVLGVFRELVMDGLADAIDGLIDHAAAR